MNHREACFVILCCTLIVFAGTTGLEAYNTWFVDDDAPGDPGPGDPSFSDPLEDGSGEHPFDAIQEGVDRAEDGDRVVARDGYYAGDGNRNIDFHGKSITVVSEYGPENCVIYLKYPGTGFYFHSGETQASIVRGFTITMGTGRMYQGRYYGGGISCWDGSSPLIVNCIFRDCRADYGGGISCENFCSPTVQHCVFLNNRAGLLGGAVSCREYSSPNIINCRISNNVAQEIGGGIYGYYYCDPVISDCIISENQAENNDGGGIGFYDYSSPVISHCMITNNDASGRFGQGGGISSHSSHTYISDCVISGNIAGSWGGGIYCQNYSPQIINCLIVNNRSQGGYHPGGGGVSLRFGTPAIKNCTISNNTGSPRGGGLLCMGTDPIVENTIFWENHASNGPDICLGGGGYYNEPSILALGYSDVDGGLPAIFVHPDSTVIWGPGMIDEDPLFISGPQGDYYLSQILAGQVTDSPCVDTGDPLSMMVHGTTRTDEIQDGGIIDMGYHAPLLPSNAIFYLERTQEGL